MRSRAAILPTPGDPYQLKLWFHFFQNIWGNEVDKLYVCYNSKLPKKIVDFVHDFMTKDSRVVWVYHPKMVGHGQALKELLNLATEDYVVLLEDDCLIFKKGEIDKQFIKIEKEVVGIVGSHRQSATPNIAEAALKQFHYPPHLEQFLWPNLLFTKRENLLKTDQNFGNRRFEIGEIVQELGWRVDGPVGNDTFVWASIQLKAQGHRVDYIEQYHAMAEDLTFYINHERAWAGNAPWVHLGSLSSMLTCHLYGDDGCPLGEPDHPNPTDPNAIPIPVEVMSEGGKQEMESRFANTMLAFDFSRGNAKEIGDFNDQYERAIIRARIRYNLDTNRIMAKVKIYKELYGI
ncbi:MAG: glycosyltransferase [Bacteroidetes bacterium]|nr:glycosyltransferase [Bacteroidota bacterium]